MEVLQAELWEAERSERVRTVALAEEVLPCGPNVGYRPQKCIPLFKAGDRLVQWLHVGLATGNSTRESNQYSIGGEMICSNKGS